MQIARFIQKFARDEEGVTAIEYGLIDALVGVAIIVGATALGTNLNTLFNGIATKISGVTPAG